MVAGLLVLVACTGAAPDKAEPADTGHTTDTADPADTADTGDSGDTADTAATADSGDTADSGLDDDLDGDGYTPRTGDCDDELPHVYPGAPDYCDGLDQDCDGEPIPDGSCSERGDPLAMWSWSIEGSETRWGGLQSTTGDVNGDGVTDIGFDSFDNAGDEIYGAGVWLGRANEHWEARTETPAAQWHADWPKWAGPYVSALADLDGDGFADAACEASTTADYTGAVFVLWGNPAGFSYGGAVIDEVADLMWVDRPSLEMTAVVGNGRFDPYEGEDVVVRLAESAPGKHGWAVLSPATSTERVNDFGGLVQLEWDLDSGANSAIVDDLDGDGLDELMLTGSSELVEGLWRPVYFVEGADLAIGGSMAAVAHQSWYRVSELESSASGVSDPENEPDYSGDGLSDFALTVYVDEADGTTSREMLVISDGIPEGDLNGHVHARLIGEGLAYAPVYQSVDDADGDDIPELMVSTELIESTALRTGGTIDLDVHPHYRFALDTQPSFIGGPDLTGDGRPEWIFGDVRWDPPGNGAESFERTTIIAGFDIPWGDPSKW